MGQVYEPHPLDSSLKNALHTFCLFSKILPNAKMGTAALLSPQKHVMLETCSAPSLRAQDRSRHAAWHDRICVPQPYEQFLK
jgi:hypothetical protein